MSDWGRITRENQNRRLIEENENLRREQGPSVEAYQRLRHALNDITTITSVQETNAERAVHRIARVALDGTESI